MATATGGNMDKEERIYFDETIHAIDQEIQSTIQRIDKIDTDLHVKKQDLSENYYDVDKSKDLSTYYEIMTHLEEQDRNMRFNLKKLQRQKKAPYFSRIDFIATGETEAQKIYIGLSNVKKGNSIIVYDWRAPISSLYYDFTLGDAFFMVNHKAHTGEVTLKRQYKIEDATLISYFDTSLTIEDDILQDVLSKNASPKMKQIVSSIQKEQNIIVRTEEFDNILVQGVAGSGKTSIALHRAAYLLYTHRNSLKSSDILIMSPNNIFSGYISEVLPQLGEENLVETSFDQIAMVELKKPLQSREEMLDEIATHPKQETLNEISFKSSFEYLGELLKFLKGDFLNTFTPKTMSFVTNVTMNQDNEPVTTCEVFTADETSKLFFDNFRNQTIEERLNKIAWQYAKRFSDKRHYNKTQNRDLKNRFKKFLYRFLPLQDPDKVFEIFLTRMNLSLPKSNTVGYMDKGALLIIKHYLFGFNHDYAAKYLIIDEMQDFTPVDFYLFKKLWSCPSIVLGDINQCIEKTLTRDYLQQISEYLGTELIELNKTYRSTKEIAQFTHQMIGLDHITYVNRNGDEPKLIQTTDMVRAIQQILEQECAQYDHIAIICKCQKELKQLAKEMKGKVDYTLLENPEDYSQKVLLTTCATAKGIEFDCVIVPNANAENYVNSLDKNILYVSSTRALHKLFFISNTSPTKFLNMLHS